MKEDNFDQIDPFNLPFATLVNRHNLPRISGVYFVLDGDEILYIGQSQNIRSRWMKHHRLNQLNGMKTENILISWLKIQDLEILPVAEKSLINRLNPLLNRTVVESFGKDCRTYIASPNSYNLDMLKMEVFLSGKKEIEVVTDFVMQALDQNETQRNKMVQYLADRQGLEFWEMWNKLLNQANGLSI